MFGFESLIYEESNDLSLLSFRPDVTETSHSATTSIYCFIADPQYLFRST